MSGMVVVAISIVGVAFLTMFFVALCRESWKAKNRTLVLFDGGAALVEVLNEDSVEVRKDKLVCFPHGNRRARTSEIPEQRMIRFGKY